MKRLLVIVLIALAACRQAAPTRGELKPQPTPVAPLTLAIGPTEVDFASLNREPNAYRLRLIRVSGALRRLPPADCAPQRGPGTRWALVNEGLRLDARGLEHILSLVPRDTVITVDGVWRLYDGPLGCGKEPPRGNAWYLEALRVVAPNPLPGFGPLPVVEPPLGGSLGPPAVAPPATPDSLETATPGPTPTPSVTASTTPTPRPGTPTVTALPTITFTPTRPPTRTPIPSATSPLSATPTASVTPGGSPTARPTSPGGGIATATPGPPVATFTPVPPYPGPTPRPSPTSGYP